MGESGGEGNQREPPGGGEILMPKTQRKRRSQSSKEEKMTQSLQRSWGRKASAKVEDWKEQRRSDTGWPWLLGRPAGR